LGRVGGTRDERVELDAGLEQRVEGADGRDEDLRPARVPRGVRVARGEVDGVVLREVVPRKRVVAPGEDALAGRGVEVGEAAAVRAVAAGGADGDAAAFEVVREGGCDLVVAERREE